MFIIRFLLLVELKEEMYLNMISNIINIFKNKRDSSEFAENLRVSFENMIFEDTIGKSEIDIIVTVIQGDGSAKSAIFNAVTMALMDAGISMKDLVVSATVGINN